MMAKDKSIAIIDYNISNMFSIENALKSIGFKTKITSDHKTILSSDGAVLPGVGSFPEAMKNINKLNLDQTISDFISTGKPFLGICLGFQLLFEESDEIIDTKGLGIIKGQVKSFSSLDKNLRIPHVGWNKVNKINDKNSMNIIKNENYFYFVHSNFVEPANDKLVYSKSEYEGFEFCSSITKDNVFACQFHPEKSGKQGIKILDEIFNI